MNRLGFLVLVFAIGCKDSLVTIPGLVTAEVSVSYTTAQSGGAIVFTGGYTISDKGVCWSVKQSPTINDQKTSDGSGEASYVSSISGLVPNTTYYLRAYATSGAGTGYGKVVSFTTLEVSLPIVSTTEIQSILGHSAMGGGTITSDGGQNVLMRGICWSTSQLPSISDNHSNTGSGVGSYTCAITGLSPGVTYFVRAFATTSAGTGYGNAVSFIAHASTLPTLITAEVKSILGRSATGGGSITSDGGEIVMTRGICWSTAPMPTISDSHNSEGSGVGSFISAMTGLNPGTTYYVRTFAYNNEGFAYGNQVSFTTLADLPYISIAAGYEHSLAVKSDGTLWAWGSNYYGQLGNGAILSSDPFLIGTLIENTPVLIGTGYAAVAAGSYHSLAIKSDGTLWAWGNGISTPVLVGTDYALISGGGNHSLAIKNDGSLWAWGYNNYGQLGDATNLDRPDPVMIGTGYKSIAAGVNFSLTFKADGSLWGFGDNQYGQLGDGTTDGRNPPVLLGSGYASVAAGNFQSLAIKADHTLWTWGNGPLVRTPLTTPVQLDQDYVFISAGSGDPALLLGIRTDGTLWGWFNQNYPPTLTQVYIGSGYATVACGGLLSLALKADGTLWTFRNNVVSPSYPPSQPVQVLF